VLCYDGSIYIYDNLQFEEKVCIDGLEELSNRFRSQPWFAMGFPYYLRIRGELLALSSDHGVLVLKSTYLTKFAM
jgi:hypothetical protein